MLAVFSSSSTGLLSSHCARAYLSQLNLTLGEGPTDDSCVLDFLGDGAAALAAAAP